MIERSIPYQTYQQDTMMKARKIENGLALAAAIVVLIGVSSAADNAFAQENADVTTTSVATHNAVNDTLSGAARANAETAAEAVASLTLENRIELDIRLGDRTSTSIARGK